MNIIRARDAEHAGKIAANMFLKQINSKPESVLGLATGSTPLTTYAALAKAYENGEVDFSRVRSVNLDEYVGLAPDHDQSYRYFMNENLFKHVNIKLENTFVPDGLTDDVEGFCAAYERNIELLGGIDLQILGMGHNGHIAFNEPADEFTKYTHRVELTQSSINANARFFASVDDVPKTAISMGIVSIMRARKIVMIVFGESKAEALAKAINGPIDPHVPASILQAHPDVTIIADDGALSKL